MMAEKRGIGQGAENADVLVRCGKTTAVYLLDCMGLLGKKTVGGCPVQDRATP